MSATDEREAARAVSLSFNETLQAIKTDSKISFADSGAVDAFGRLRVSSPTVTLFESQLTYDLQPLLYEQITNGSGATIAHDATNRNALLTFSSSPTGGKAIMQSFEHMRYQPGKSQFIAMTFNMLGGVANTVKFVGYSDGTNGIEFAMAGLTPTVRIFSSTGNGNQSIIQSNWNLDKLDGTGVSGITFNASYAQILIIDFQALYTGRVRIGFNIDGVDFYVHEFLHANNSTHPYLATANLPVRCGMTCTGTVSTTMKFQCATVSTEGGQDLPASYHFTTESSVTAASGARTHALSIRPQALFNSFANRGKFILDSVSILVTGNSPVKYELCIGQAISGTTTFSSVNATYAAIEVNTAGTISGSPAIVFDIGYIAASNQFKGVLVSNSPMKYPITLDAAGVARLLGTVSVVVEGVGGASACRVSLNWHGIR